MTVEEDNISNVKESLFDSNMSALKLRWPDIFEKIDELEGDVEVNISQDTPTSTIIVNGKHLTSCYNREFESQLLAQKIDINSSIAHLYGIALADVINILLAREQIKKLHVYILSPIIFNIYLMLCDDAKSWLIDPRLELHFADGIELNKPFTYSSGELFFADEGAEIIRNKILLSANESHVKLQHILLDDDYNENIQKNLKYLAMDPFVDQLENSLKDKKIILVAGGPTVNEQFKFIKENRNDYLLICVNSSLIALEKKGIYPNFVIAIEQSSEIMAHFKMLDKNKYIHIPLIYLPSTCPNVVKSWPGPRVVAVTDLKHDQYYKLVYPNSVLFSGGSVAHSAASLAIKLGAKEIVLIGYDFCYSTEKTHLEGNPLAKSTLSNSEHWSHNGLGEKVATQVNLLSYKDAMEELISMHENIKFSQRGKGGLSLKGATWMK